MSVRQKRSTVYRDGPYCFRMSMLPILAITKIIIKSNELAVVQCVAAELSRLHPVIHSCQSVLYIHTRLRRCWLETSYSMLDSNE